MTNETVKRRLWIMFGILLIFLIVAIVISIINYIDPLPFNRKFRTAMEQSIDDIEHATVDRIPGVYEPSEDSYYEDSSHLKRLITFDKSYYRIVPSDVDSTIASDKSFEHGEEER